MDPSQLPLPVGELAARGFRDPLVNAKGFLFSEPSDLISLILRVLLPGAHSKISDSHNVIFKWLTRIIYIKIPNFGRLWTKE